uniref:DUF4283 domain-containing protein n=1 Tax=Setaria viridis TaxID=4556 RepID=A0A4U6TGY0_SETVI|nr:hypothetical protein SEVIR_8G086900v2 [Setaria viridis]
MERRFQGSWGGRDQREVEKGVEVVQVDKPIRAIVTVHEGRVDWKVCRLSSNEFLIAVPSVEVLNFLRRMGRIKFTCSNIQGSVQETDRDFDSFDGLHTVWKEQHVMELAYLVGDPEEVHLESLNWRDVWIKVACKNLKAINGTSEVYINKQGHMIEWFVDDRGPTKPSTYDKQDDEGDVTDEENPESQDSYNIMDNYDWLKFGALPPQGGLTLPKPDGGKDQGGSTKRGDRTNEKMDQQEMVEDQKKGIGGMEST